MKKTIKIIALAMVALMLMLALVSCGAKPNSDFEKAKAALEENGYDVKSNPDAEDKTISASKDSQYVSICYFSDEEKAKTFYEAKKEAYEELKKAAEELGEDLDYEFGISGTMVWEGTPDAIKAAS